MLEYSAVPVSPTDLVDGYSHQSDLASDYLALCEEEPEQVAALNAAIVARWGQDGLTRIKRLAWREREEHRRG